MLGGARETHDLLQPQARGCGTHRLSPETRCLGTKRGWIQFTSEGNGARAGAWADVRASGTGASWHCPSHRSAPGARIATKRLPMFQYYTNMSNDALLCTVNIAVMRGAKAGRQNGAAVGTPSQCSSGTTLQASTRQRNPYMRAMTGNRGQGLTQYRAVVGPVSHGPDRYRAQDPRRAFATVCKITQRQKHKTSVALRHCPRLGVTECAAV